MVDFITTDLSKPFSMFGVSDEVFRIKGGSSALITALVNALQNKIEMKQGFALTELDQKDKQIVMSFEAPGGAQSASFDAVILALPFTKLRQVKGLEGLKLGAEKLKCIRELGYGINAKIMNGTTSRVWRAPTRAFPRRRTAPSTPISASRPLWETSRAQPGEAGIITNYLGAKPGLTDAKSALDAFRADLPKIDVPILVVHGDADRVLPFEKTGKRLPGLIKDMQLVVIAGGPHAISWTHADQVNRALLDFVQAVEIRGTSPLKATASSAPN
ncbi:MAG TPA: hypothetical protein DCL72_04090 [Rhizobiales bacterium]|nr:hypothetical protein [Hyphomicrobiales bacterium]